MERWELIRVKVAGSSEINRSISFKNVKWLLFVEVCKFMISDDDENGDDVCRGSVSRLLVVVVPEGGVEGGSSCVVVFIQCGRVMR